MVFPGLLSLSEWPPSSKLKLELCAQASSQFSSSRALPLGLHLDGGWGSPSQASPCVYCLQGHLPADTCVSVLQRPLLPLQSLSPTLQWRGHPSPARPLALLGVSTSQGALRRQARSTLNTGPVEAKVRAGCFQFLALSEAEERSH